MTHDCVTTSESFAFPTGKTALAVTGSVGSDLRAALPGGFLDFSVGTISAATHKGDYDCKTVSCATGAATTDAERAAMAVTEEYFDAVAPPIVFRNVLRARGGSGERLVLLGDRRVATGTGFRRATLDPSYLYNVADQRFYRLTPPLAATPLPAKLSGTATTDGDYDVVTRP